jgi:hypothetical protein
MLSYRHAFHAGNHADILKHFVLMLCLRAHERQGQALAAARHPRRRPASTRSIRTRRKRPANTSTASPACGTASTCQPPMKPYMDALQACNGGLKLRRYPGSPWLAALLRAREIDTLRFCELHSTDFGPGADRSLLRDQERLPACGRGDQGWTDALCHRYLPGLAALPAQHRSPRPARKAEEAARRLALCQPQPCAARPPRATACTAARCSSSIRRGR